MCRSSLFSAKRLRWPRSPAGAPQRREIRPISCCAARATQVLAPPRKAVDTSNNDGTGMAAVLRPGSCFTPRLRWGLRKCEPFFLLSSALPPLPPPPLSPCERHSSSWQRRLPCACATLAQLAIGMCEALPLFIAALTASTVAHCVLRTVNGQSSSPLVLSPKP